MKLEPLLDQGLVVPLSVLLCQREVNVGSIVVREGYWCMTDMTKVLIEHKFGLMKVAGFREEVTGNCGAVNRTRPPIRVDLVDTIECMVTK